MGRLQKHSLDEMLPNVIVVPRAKLCINCLRARPFAVALEPPKARNFLRTLEHNAMMAGGGDLREEKEQEAFKYDDCARAIMFLTRAARGNLHFKSSPEQGMEVGSMGFVKAW